jgi:hypothetical protein
LYTNAEEDDARAMREAGLAAAEEVRAKSLKTSHATSTGEDEVRIDVDGILKAK